MSKYSEANASGPRAQIYCMLTDRVVIDAYKQNIELSQGLEVTFLLQLAGLASVCGLLASCVGSADGKS